MKKYFLLSLFLFFFNYSYSQQNVKTWSAEPHIGLSFSNLTDADLDTKLGFVIGANFQYQFNNTLGLVVGVDYANYGAKDDNANLTLGYLDVPIQAKFYIYKGLALQAGMQFGYNVYDGRTDFILPTDAQKFVVGVPIGLSYDFKKISIKGQYVLGLSKTYKDYDYKNRSFELTIGYKFKL